MNYNLITYTIYLPIICFIMIRIGWLFYKNGEIFLLTIFNNDITLSKSINNLLLTGYYLINIGYAIVTIAYWQPLINVLESINSLSTTIGKIILLLSILHFNNVFWLKHITKSNYIKQ